MRQTSLIVNQKLPAYLRSHFNERGITRTFLAQVLTETAKVLVHSACYQVICITN